MYIDRYSVHLYQVIQDCNHKQPYVTTQYSFILPVWLHQEAQSSRWHDVGYHSWWLPGHSVW